MVPIPILLVDCHQLLYDVRCILVAEIALQIFPRPLLITVVTFLRQVDPIGFWVGFHEEVRSVHCVLF